jgi:2-aminoethylphosphonate-pyruvate transaminase
LYDYYKSQYTSGFSPFTQATHVAMAFQIALEEFFEAGGWKQRNKLYKMRADQIADSLLVLGVKTLLPVSDFSSVLYSYLLPSGVSYYELHDYLKNKGFVIYQGQGNLQDTIFRISTMGEISMDDIHCLCDDFNQFFNGS